MAARKADPFTAHVSASSKKALKSSSGEIANALGKLVSARLRRSVRRPQAFPAVMQAEQDALLAHIKRARRSSRRRRGNQHYTSTGKVDVSRLNTFRHYMLTTIRRHTSTWDAEAEHALCHNPKFAKNRLDFGWAAAEGYITFD